MKKNVFRVIALALVASMLFAFASCTQEIHVRFVDKDGNDIDISGLIGGSVQVGNNNDTPAPTPTPEVTTQAPQQTPSNETTTAAPQQSETTTAAPQQGEATTAAPAPGNKMPSTTNEIVEFYKKAVNDIKNNAVAGYTKKEWQAVDKINITGIGFVDDAIVDVLGNFMTVEADAQEQLSDKGSDDAKNRIGGWTLTDLSKVASAKCEPAGSNYKLTIVMQDEDTPKKSGSVLGQVTNSLLYWEDIDDTLSNDPTVTKILTSYSNIHVWYRHYTIVAEMTPDGKFISIDHLADVDILIGEAKILIATIKDKSGHMVNTCKFYNFKY